jgi:hypothetical protein
MNYLDICRRAIAGKPRGQYLPPIGDQPGRNPAFVGLPAGIIRGALNLAPTTDIKAALTKSTASFPDEVELFVSVDDLAAVLDSVVSEI